MIKRCAWCGRAFEAKSKRAAYCSTKCRVAHHRAKETGARYTPDGEPPAFEPGRISEDDIASAVFQTRGAISTFDAGRSRAPKDMRELCARLTDGLSAVLEEVGL